MNLDLYFSDPYSGWRERREEDQLSSPGEKERDPHVSSTNYSPEFILNVTRGLKSMKEVMRVVEEQRAVVPY